MSATKQQRVILVTGANRGLGFEVIKKLLSEPSTGSNDLILLGSRDLKRGEETLAKLGSPSNVRILQLDTSSPESIARAVDEIKRKYNGQLDILVNNAGIVTRDFNVEAVKEVFATNYYGIKLLNEQLSPLIRENGRIVNVASEVGSWTLHDFSKEIQDKFQSSTLTKEQIDSMLKEFTAGVESNTLEKLGYTGNKMMIIYGMSKVALIALTRVEARDWSHAKNVLVLSVCPGYCATDMNKGAPGARPAELGADSILHPVNAPFNELKNGQFYQDGQEKGQNFACTMDFSKLQQDLNL